MAHTLRLCRVDAGIIRGMSWTGAAYPGPVRGTINRAIGPDMGNG